MFSLVYLLNFTIGRWNPVCPDVIPYAISYFIVKMLAGALAHIFILFTDLHIIVHVSSCVKGKLHNSTQFRRTHPPSQILNPYHCQPMCGSSWTCRTAVCSVQYFFHLLRFHGSVSCLYQCSGYNTDHII